MNFNLLQLKSDNLDSNCSNQKNPVIHNLVKVSNKLDNFLLFLVAVLSYILQLLRPIIISFIESTKYQLYLKISLTLILTIFNIFVFLVASPSYNIGYIFFSIIQGLISTWFSVYDVLYNNQISLFWSHMIYISLILCPFTNSEYKNKEWKIFEQYFFTHIYVLIITSVNL